MSKNTISWKRIIRIKGNRAKSDNERMIFMSVQADNTSCLDKAQGTLEQDDES